jgi:hypothetical protein
VKTLFTKKGSRCGQTPSFAEKPIFKRVEEGQPIEENKANNRKLNNLK